jgi:hypothetical protein
MRILQLFDKYFLILMLIQCFILIFWDSRNFKRMHEYGLVLLSRIIVAMIILFSVIMYIVGRFM